MTMRASLVSLMASAAMPGAIRAGQHNLAMIGSMPGAVRMSSHYLAYVGGADVTKSVRMSGHYVFNVQSIHRAFYPNFLQSGQIFGFTEWQVDIASAEIPEFNPYRPRIPEALFDMGSDFYNFAEENQNIHREQHNLQQAGDTTFPWQLFSQTHTDKQFTLGSVGRFYHEEWGLIQARYVRFDFMTSTTWVSAPVGLIKNTNLHEWTVTNRYDLSDPDLVVGVIAGLVTPADGEYGWVIIDGPNLQEVENSSSTAVQGEAFAWDATGSVSNTATGRVIGRRVNKVTSGTRLELGQLYIQLESFSLKEIEAQIQSVTAALQAAVTQLQSDINLIKSLTVLDDTFLQLQNKLASLQTQLDNEKRARQQADQSITTRINNLNFATTGQLGAAVTNLQNSLSALQTSLTARINTVETTALQALALAQAAGDLQPIWDQITIIMGLIAELDSRPKNKFPVVDGSVPPNLVYLDDGTLVYTETK